MTSYKYTKNRKVHGIGINDADYAVLPRINGRQTECPYYSKWTKMLERCYSEKLHKKHPTYIGCTVCDEWLLFMNFRKWMKTKDWQGKQLDKDLLILENKIYSPATCLFVSAEINTLMGAKTKQKNSLPVGVYRQKGTKKFTAGLATYGKRAYIGSFDTEETASEAYREAKRLHVLKIACCEPSIIIKQSLFRYSESLR